MDIRKFFGSPSAKKLSVEVKENNNNNGDTKRAGKPETGKKNKIITKAREPSKERKTTPHKSKRGKGKEEKKTKKTEDDDVEFVEEKKSRKSHKSASSDNEVSVQKSKPQVSLEDSDDEEFEEILQTRKAKKSGRSRKGILYESDSEEEPLPKKAKRKSSEYQSVYIVDSDEDSSKKKKRQSPLKAFMKTAYASKPVAEVKKKAEDQAKRTPVSASDFFGGDSVRRVERRQSTKRKLEADDPAKSDDNDADIHDDSDFERTLDQLDEQETKAKKKRIEEKPPKEEVTPSKTSLSSKLSSLAKSSKVLVEETPEPKSKPDRRSSPRKSVSIDTSAANKTPHKEVKKSIPAKDSSSNSAEKKTPDKSPLEKKSSTGYRNFLHRDGPQSLGSKEFPQAEPNCLEGMTFVLTGVLESFERDEMKRHIEKYGGKVTGSISKKTSYVVVGRDAGESKLNKAKQCGTKLLNEDEVLELVKTLKGKRSKYEIQAEQEIKKENAKAAHRNFMSKEKFVESPKSVTSSVGKSEQKPSNQSTSVSAVKPTETDISEPSLLWVDKYKPNSLKKIIGQTGDKSNANKLFHWLKNWHKSRSLGKKPTGGFFGKNDDGSGFRASLLSGPPGVGKTTTATLVCQEADFSYVELNASDTRSKKSLENIVAESLTNQTLVDFMGDTKRSSSIPLGKNHCIIMDEVDGVAGNEDRGGIQELILLIKQTRIPIICICNDRNHQKMRSLVNHCFDLRFYKPRLEQIKGAMMSIIFREGLSIPPPALNEIILAANQDVRQVIHNLSMWCSTSKSITFEQAQKDSQKAKKDLKIGPFDVCRKVFEGGEEKRKMSVIDKSDLFFNDYSIAPLFVHENYIHVNPYSARGSVGKHLSQLARASDSICTGDLIEKKIRSQSKWGLLPMEAIFASVVPGEEMQGGISQMIAFPSWLGKNSSQNKNDRILQELHTHMSLHISSDKRGLNMDYLPYMRKSLTDPLVREESDGVKEVIAVMDGYNITKDDFDSVMDVTKWPNSSDPFSSLSSKTKAAFTRAYNKESHMTPYAVGDGTKKKKGKVGGADDSELLGEEGEGGAIVESEEEDEGLGNNGMIKMKKALAASKKASAGKASGKAKTTEKKGKGRGKAKGKS